MSQGKCQSEMYEGVHIHFFKVIIGRLSSRQPSSYKGT